MGCEECLTLLSEFLDGSLGAEHRELFAAHLGGCLKCEGVRGDIELIIRLARELREDFSHVPSPVLKASLFSRPFHLRAIN